MFKLKDKQSTFHFTLLFSYSFFFLEPPCLFSSVSVCEQSPFIIYEDTEALVTKVEQPTAEENTLRETKHVPCSIGFIVVRSDGEVVRRFFYRGLDAIKVFFSELEKVCRPSRFFFEDVAFCFRLGFFYFLHSLLF